MPGKPDFGAQMAALRKERGVKNPGRPPITETYGKFVKRTNEVFAKAMPQEAQAYVDNLSVEAPEECPMHGRILSCSQAGCHYQSHRTEYKHREAQYIFDRILGRPTQRLEQTVTFKLVQEITAAIVGIFSEVNSLDDAQTRSQTFAAKCEELGTNYGGLISASVQ